MNDVVGDIPDNKCVQPIVSLLLLLRGDTHTQVY